MSVHHGINDWIASHLIIESYSVLSGKSENALWVVLTDRASLVLWTCVNHDNHDNERNPFEHDRLCYK